MKFSIISCLCCAFSRSVAYASTKVKSFYPILSHLPGGEDKRRRTAEQLSGEGFDGPKGAGCACDKAVLPKEVCEPPPPPKPAAKPAAPPPPPPAPPKPKPPAPPTVEKVTFAADALFDFDKYVIRPDARAKLDDLVSKLAGVNLEVIVAVGHTDSIGTHEYNMALSQRRANAVKQYLVSKGIEANRIYTEGKGKTQPVADNRTAEGRQKNRRVEIEVIGTRAAKR